MNKQEMIRSMKSQYGDFLSMNEVASYLRIDRGTARQLLYGVPYLPMGRKKLFSASDVATRVKSKERT